MMTMESQTHNLYDYNDSFTDDEDQFNYQVPACEGGSS